MPHRLNNSVAVKGVWSHCINAHHSTICVCWCWRRLGWCRLYIPIFVPVLQIWSHILRLNCTKFQPEGLHAFKLWSEVIWGNNRDSKMILWFTPRACTKRAWVIFMGCMILWFYWNVMGRKCKGKWEERKRMRLRQDISNKRGRGELEDGS